jgi:hypothetical protein
LLVAAGLTPTSVGASRQQTALSFIFIAQHNMYVPAGTRYAHTCALIINAAIVNLMRSDLQICFSALAYESVHLSSRFESVSQFSQAVERHSSRSIAGTISILFSFFASTNIEKLSFTIFHHVVSGFSLV